MLFSKNHKIETTFGFILKAQSLGALTGLIVLSIFLSSLKELNAINVGMLCSFVFMTYSYFYFYKKHRETINKFQTS